jgi:hypothetical protein
MPHHKKGDELIDPQAGRQGHDPKTGDADCKKRTEDVV